MSERARIFLVYSSLYILAYFYRVSLAVLSRDLAAEAGLTASQLGTLSGAFFYAFAAAQIPLGPILDALGGKRTALIFGVMTAAGVLLFSLARSYPLLLVGRILMGAGSASVLMGALKTFTNWFDQAEFARVSGFVIAAGNLGNVAGTSPFAFACGEFGWRTTFLAVFVLQCIALLTLLMIREGPVPNPTRKFSPAALAHDFRRILTTPLYLPLVLIAFFWYACYMSVQGLWGGPYLRDVAGFSPDAAAFSLLCSSAGFLAGSLLVGRCSELLGSNARVMLRGETLLLVVMGYFLLPAATVPRTVVPFVFFLIGFFVASGVAIYPLIRERFPREIIGTALTAVNLFILLGAATLQQVMGIVIDRFGAAGGIYPETAYHAAFLIPMAGLACALAIFRAYVTGRGET